MHDLKNNSLNFMICNINTITVRGSIKKKTNSDKIGKNNFQGGGRFGCGEKVNGGV